MNINYLKPLLEEKTKSLGFELCSITTKKEAGTLYLSLTIDRIQPIDLNTISDFSNEISSYLDEIDQSDEKYTLDVCSLGAEKPLKIESLNDYIGQYINVHIVNPIDGLNIFEGTLEEVTDTSILVSYHIKTRVKMVSILLCNIYKIRLAIKF